MADRTSIEWTDASWTPVKGCTRKSPGCVNCYAEIMAARFSQAGMWGEGLARIVDTPQGKDHRWTGEMRFDEKELLKPLRWRAPRRVFVCSTSDLFHESVPDEWIDRVFAVMALCPQHTFQVLTKRSARMLTYISDFEHRPTAFAMALVAVVRGSGLPVEVGRAAIENMHWPLPNVWLGVSVEDQQRADERVPDLLATPAAVRWVSCEPLLGPVDLCEVAIGPRNNSVRVDALTGCEWDELGERPSGAWLDWVVAGGESGPHSRGSTEQVESWMRVLRDQCAADGIAFFGKQNFRKLPLPADLMVREYPHG